MHAGARPHLRVLIVSVDQALLRGDDLDQRGVPAMRGAEVRQTLETAKVVRRPAHSGVAAGSSGSTFFAAGFAAGAAAGAGAGAATGAGSATAAGASLIMTTRLLCGTMRTPLNALTPATSIVSAVNCIDRLDLLMSSFVSRQLDWTRGGHYSAYQKKYSGQPRGGGTFFGSHAFGVTNTTRPPRAPRPWRHGYAPAWCC